MTHTETETEDGTVGTIRRQEAAVSAVGRRNARDPAASRPTGGTDGVARTPREETKAGTRIALSRADDIRAGE